MNSRVFILSTILLLVMKVLVRQRELYHDHVLLVDEAITDLREGLTAASRRVSFFPRAAERYRQKLAGWGATLC